MESIFRYFLKKKKGGGEPSVIRKMLLVCGVEFSDD